MPNAIVVGMGGMGSSVAYHLARAGFQVTGIDRFRPPHDRGSSFGSVRIIRQAYFEDPRYIPLLKHVYTLWEEVMDQGFPSLFHRAGLLVLSGERDGTVDRIQSNAQAHGVPIESLSYADVRRRFPQFHMPESHFGIFEPGAGFLESENCVQAHFDLAERKGVKFIEVEVREWSSGPTGVRVKTEKDTLHADLLFFCAGAWTESLLGQFGMQLDVRRAPQFWFEPGPGHTEAEGMPCFAFSGGGEFIYGFPSIDGWGLKAASYAPSTPIPDLLDTDSHYTREEIASIARDVEKYLGVNPKPVRSHICKYTLSRDENFLIGHHPHHANVILATAGSGHAFKFLPLIGELTAHIAMGKAPPYDASFLRFRADVG